MRFMWKLSLSIALTGLLTTACVPGGGDEEEEEDVPIPVEETATSNEEEVAVQQQQEQQIIEDHWSCGAVKQHIHTVVNNLLEAEQDAYALARAHSLDNFAEQGATLPETLIREIQNVLVDPDEIAVEPEQEYRIRSFEATLSGFTSADQLALNASCEFYGQHQAALELWAAGNRGDACDVWVPAKQRAEAKEQEIDVSVLHPITSKFWVGATGSISEGFGKCIAERAN